MRAATGFRFVRQRGAPPLIWAHRGSSRAVLENTIASFSRAISDGADGIELDVRTTRDGAVIVLHDLDLTRVTDGRDARRACDLSRQALSQIELREGHRVPTLAEVLDLCDQAGALLNIELKHDVDELPALVRGVARLLDGRQRIAERVMLSSFEPKLLMLAAVLLPRVPRALLVHRGQRLARTTSVAWIARAIGAEGLNPERTLCDPARVERWRARVGMLHVWTVNDPSEARDLAALGVDGLITDVPGELRGALGK